MRRSSCLVLCPLIALIASLSACDRKNEAYGLTARDELSGRMFKRAEPTSVAAFAPAAPQHAQDTLAYEHNVTIEIAKERITARSEEIQKACRSDASLACALLDVSTNSDERFPSATLRMRLAPSGVDSLTTVASKDAKVTMRNTHAEDLAEPVADTERQLSLLTTHRARLDELMKGKNLTVDQLITVSRELATVQTQIEQFSTTRANLRRRIDTDLLTINLTVPPRDISAAQTPVSDAFRSFGIEMKQAFAQVITFIAILLPWLLVLIPGLFIVRWLWRRTGRWLQRRELRNAPTAS
jgi:hypothetical protein